MARVQQVVGVPVWARPREDSSIVPDRRPLPGDTTADVAIVGAGFTGLWTAHHLLADDPTLRVVLVDREAVGSGASGRNGGWCIGAQGAPLAALEAAKRGGARATVVAMQRSVDDIERTIAAHGIDCAFAKAGAITLAMNAAQMNRLLRWRRELGTYGIPDALDALSADDVTEIVHAVGVCGGIFNRHAAALDPARLAFGIAAAIEHRGGVIHERTTVRSIAPGVVRTDRGTIRAEVVVRATEAYTPSLAGQRRELLPLGNDMIATEALPASTWDAIGLARRELCQFMVPSVCYMQRTADDRIAVGGLGTPYRWGSDVGRTSSTNGRTAARLRRVLVRRFPVLDGVRITHHWGGVVAVPKDLRPSVGLDRRTGLGWAGGYMGTGIAASNTAGRTLADLIQDRATELTRLPWVDHRSPRWEPEPARWIGVTARKVHVRVRREAEDRGLVRAPAGNPAISWDRARTG